VELKNGGLAHDCVDGLVSWREDQSIPYLANAAVLLMPFSIS
jgi:hypothetical protein